MKLAFIPPHALLSYTFSTDYQLMLPQLTVNYDYATTYKRHCEDDQKFVILDNGAAEGADINTETLVHVAKEFEPQELVVPDVIGDYRASKQRAHDFFNDHRVRGLRDAGMRFMVVIQGRNIAEVMQCLFDALDSELVDTIGIPRHLITTLNTFSARAYLGEASAAKNPSKPVHFLGGNAVLPRELQMLMTFGTHYGSTWRGMDTSMPFNYAYAEKYQSEDGYAQRPKDYFDLPPERFSTRHLVANVRDMMGWSQQYA